MFPFTFAVTIAPWFDVTTPEFAKNVALACPVPTVTLPGTARRTLLLPRDTPIVLAAALFNVAVHVDVVLLPIVLGEQERDCNCARAKRFTEAVLVTLPALAVIVTPF